MFQGLHKGGGQNLVVTAGMMPKVNRKSSFILRQRQILTIPGVLRRFSPRLAETAV
jgi:hypothetical protein